MIIYGLHSLRSGGITSAVRNSSNSIPERLLKIHGRWKSDSAKDMYVEENMCPKICLPCAWSGLDPTR